MMRLALMVALAGLAFRAWGAVLSAQWGTSPSAPVYVGQAYDLTLTVETASEEQVTGLTLDQGPRRAPDEQSSSVQGKVRKTVFRWTMDEPAPKLIAIPEGRLSVELTTEQTFGFIRSASTTRRAAKIPAFSYSAQALPQGATGLPVGVFAQSLRSDDATYRPGDVRAITATLVAKEGRIPEGFAFAWAQTPKGRVYPFREVKREKNRLEAQAWIVPEGEEPVATVQLKAVKAFDVRKREAQEVACAPLMLHLKDEDADDDAGEDVTIGGASGKGVPLRLAPAEGAPLIGTLEGPPEKLEERGAWVLVRGASGSGWVREARLKKGTP